jgi:hypothetical protein
MRQYRAKHDKKVSHANSVQKEVGYSAAPKMFIFRDHVGESQTFLDVVATPHASRAPEMFFACRRKTQ